MFIPFCCRQKHRSPIQRQSWKPRRAMKMNLKQPSSRWWQKPQPLLALPNGAPTRQTVPRKARSGLVIMTIWQHCAIAITTWAISRLRVCSVIHSGPASAASAQSHSLANKGKKGTHGTDKLHGVCLCPNGSNSKHSCCFALCTVCHRKLRPVTPRKRHDKMQKTSLWRQ